MTEILFLVINERLNTEKLEKEVRRVRLKESLTGADHLALKEKWKVEPLPSMLFTPILPLCLFIISEQM